MPDEAGEKTEQPTPKKREEAREQGQVARSQDLSAAGGLLGAVGLLYLLGARMFQALQHHLQALLAAVHAPDVTRAGDLAAIAAFTGRTLITTVLPVLGVVMMAGLVSTLGQTGLMLSGKPLTPRPDKLSPLKGAKNLFNLRAGMRLLMSLGKLAALSAVALAAIYADLPAVLSLTHLGIAPAAGAAGRMVAGLAFKLGAVLLVLAVLDYAYQRWQHEQDLKMSKQEVKEEMKKMEGDPEQKKRRKQVAQQLTEQRVNREVPTADVIVNNPTHFSIALRYDGGSMRAPKVVAKGADHLAYRIRRLAAQHQVPQVERKPLAQALYHGVEEGQEVPPEHYAAVAEVLAYVYRLSHA